MAGNTRIGIDLGGTKIEAIAMAPDGAILVRERIATPPGYAETLDALERFVPTIEAKAGVGPCPVGLGMPGSRSPRTGLARNANSVWLNGKPFHQDLSARLQRPLRMANDANCFTLSEAVDGAGAGATVVFGVIIGTGCGGGVAVNGHVLNGASAIAGEWGHTPLPWPDLFERDAPLCWCGRPGCMETWVSGPGFARAAAAEFGLKASPRDIVALAGQNTAPAQDALTRLVDRLARGLAVVIDILDPDVIVLGGGMSRIEALYPALPARIEQHIFSDVWCGRVVPNQHGDSSGVRGAAWLWRPDEG